MKTATATDTTDRRQNLDRMVAHADEKGISLTRVLSAKQTRFMYDQLVAAETELAFLRTRDAHADEVIQARNKRLSEIAVQSDLLRAALAGLVGVDGKDDLEQMEGVMRLMPAPAADKAATIDAIHALIATLPNFEAAALSSSSSPSANREPQPASVSELARNLVDALAPLLDNADGHDVSNVRAAFRLGGWSAELLDAETKARIEWKELRRAVSALRQPPASSALQSQEGKDRAAIEVIEAFMQWQAGVQELLPHDLHTQAVQVIEVLKASAVLSETKEPQPDDRYYSLRDAVGMYSGDGVISEDAVINEAAEHAKIAANCTCAISDDRTERGAPQLRVVPLLSVQRLEWAYPYGSEEPYVKVADLDKISRASRVQVSEESNG